MSSLLPRRALTVWLLVLGALAALLSAPAAYAQKKAEPARVAFYGTGPDLKPTREAVKRALPDGVELDQGRFTRELQKGGALGPEFDKSPRLGKRVQTAMQRSKVAAAVLARTYRKKKDRMVHVLVFTPGSAEPEVDATVKLGKQNSDSEWVELNDAVFPVLSKLAPEPEPKVAAGAKGKDKATPKGKDKAEAKDAKPEPKPKAKPGAAKKPEPEEEEEEEEEAAAEDEEAKDDEETEEGDAADDEKPSEDEAGTSAPGGAFDRNAALAIVSLLVSGGGRDFGYNDARSLQLRDYSTGNLLMLGLRLELYPLASSRGFAKNLGLAGKFDWALPFKSKGPPTVGAESTEFDGSYSAFELGLRYRLAISRSALGFGIGFGKETFSFSGAGEPYNDIAGADYSYLRVGIDGRFPIGPVALLAAAGYRLVLSGGSVADNFRDTSLAGMDARLGAALPLGERFEAFLALRYARYGYSMSPRPSDPFIAGGALDQLYALELGGSLGF